MTAVVVANEYASLDSVLDNRRWLRRTKPFTHVIVRDVFTARTYRRLLAGLEDVLSSVPGQGYLERHDIHGATLTSDRVEDFDPLLSRGWHDLLAGVFGVQATGHVLCGIHHHFVGSADGFPHNDLNSGWFASDPLPGSIELSAPYHVDYSTGKRLVESADPTETVRAVAAIYYLGNPEWSPGDGGSTGLYRRASDAVDRPLLKVPPRNNSLFAFECTPNSYHGFISNPHHPRNSIIMWLHRPKSDVVARWGEHAIVPYGLRPKPKPKR
ncbi:MAG: 2OG-Fe(II) oxygenase [Actinomycetota bacterium]|nr:2OG-Fe(II) oxygenase [Actinomycetota bacterium]